MENRRPLACGFFVLVGVVVLRIWWFCIHEEFHQALFAACGNRKLLEITRQLGADAALYRRWSDTLGDRQRDIIAEHRAILDAAIAGDAERAAELLKDHIARTARSLKDFTTDSQEEADSQGEAGSQGETAGDGPTGPEASAE